MYKLRIITVIMYFNFWHILSRYHCETNSALCFVSSNSEYPLNGKPETFEKFPLISKNMSYLEIYCLMLCVTYSHMKSSSADFFFLLNGSCAMATPTAAGCTCTYLQYVQLPRTCRVQVRCWDSRWIITHHGQLSSTATSELRVELRMRIYREASTGAVYALGK